MGSSPPPPPKYRYIYVLMVVNMVELLLQEITLIVTGVGLIIEKMEDHVDVIIKIIVIMVSLLLLIQIGPDNIDVRIVIVHFM